MVDAGASHEENKEKPWVLVHLIALLLPHLQNGGEASLPPQWLGWWLVGRFKRFWYPSTISVVNLGDNTGETCHNPHQD